MATFLVNGVAMQTTSDAATVEASSKSFTLSWSGLSMLEQWGEEYFEYSMDNATLTDEGERFYTSTRWGDNYVYEMSKYNVDVSYILLTSSSGSKTITSNTDLSGKIFHLFYRDENNSVWEDRYITFKSITPCTPPSNPKLSVSQTTGSATLSWTAGGQGTNNPVTGYVITYQDSSNGTAWGEVDYLKEVTGTSTSVDAPSTIGYYRRFGIQTKGSGGDDYLSSVVWSSALQKIAYTKATAPTSVTVASTNVAPGASIKLSWSGASAGTANAITGYEVYRSTSASGTYTKLTTVSTTATSGSVNVTAPTTSGASYYYKVLTVGTVSGYSSDQSTQYATLTCSYSAPTKVTSITIGGSSSTYATSGSNVTLAWSGATAGTNNAITGYVVYQNGTEYKTTTGTSISVPAHATAGSSYTYTVVTKGTHSNSGASSGVTVYTYSAPTAPTDISVSNDTPNADESVTLSWSGAAAGSYNLITGYHIYRSDSADGSYSYLTAVETAATSSSCSVTAPSTMGTSYYYKVYTIGSRSNSTISSAYASVTTKTYTACKAPTSVSVSSTDVKPGETVTLSWSGATAGTNNAISGYDIYRSSSPTGSYSKLKTVTTSATSGSVSVTAPSTNGSSYYYKVLTIGSVSAYNSTQSTVYATLTCSYSTPSAPTAITINGESSAYASSGEKATLEWSGATAGTNNDIVGYAIYRNGSLYVDGLENTVNSYEVDANSTIGSGYTYSVVAVGEYSNSAESAKVTIYTYGSPDAPNAISVSNSNPEANSSVTLSWRGAAAGSYNSIAGYEVYRSTSAYGTYSLIETISSTETSGSCIVVAPSAFGDSYYYKVATIGERASSAQSEKYAVITTKSYSACTAPTTFKLSTTISTGSNSTLSWSGAKSGTNNAIVQYEIQYSESSDGSNYGNWITLTTTSETSISVSPPQFAGRYYRYRIRTQGDAGVDYYSDWVISSNTLFRNYTACTAPTKLSLSSSISIEDVTLSWSGASGGDGNNIVNYEIQRCESTNGTSWSAWIALAESDSSPILVSPPNEAGSYFKYRVRARGTAGETFYSPWTESTDTLQRDLTACGAPTSCKLSATISSTNVTLSWSGATNGDGTEIFGYEVQRCESSDGASWGSWAALTTTVNESISVAPPSTAGNYYKYRVRACCSAGEEYYSDWTESSNTLRSEHAGFDEFTDPVLVSNQTPVKAVHMTEMQERVNSLLEYYGYDRVTFTSIVSNTTYLKDWTKHVTEIRNAIDTISTQHDIWIDIPVNQPTAAVIQQMRDVILSL